jgi:membrane-associated phospholipid phosphatase
LKLPNIKIFFTSIFFTGCFFITTKSNAQNWDINLLRDINPQHPNSFVWKSFTASAYPLSIATPIGFWVDSKIEHNKKTERNAYEIAGSVIIAAGATEMMKIIFNRDRPFQKYNDVYPYKYEDGKSFPSGHASLVFATATSVSLEYKKWYIVVPAYVWAAGVSYSRLYLGEHYPTDIIGSAVTGAGSAVISHWLSKKFFK